MVRWLTATGCSSESLPCAEGQNHSMESASFGCHLDFSSDPDPPSHQGLSSLVSRTKESRGHLRGRCEQTCSASICNLISTFLIPDR